MTYYVFDVGKNILLDIKKSAKLMEKHAVNIKRKII